MMFTRQQASSRSWVIPSEARGLAGPRAETPRGARDGRRGVSPSPRRCAPSSLVRAFTLIELMLSIALVLLLMIGVNSIFKTTGDAVGAGQRLGDATRGQQALQSVFAQDLASALQDPPVFWITNEQVYMYTNWDDYRANSQGEDPWYVDLNANGVRGEAGVPGERVPAYFPNYRSHRIDTMGFFARGNFRRNTGNAGEGVAPTTSADAFVWYGHATTPNKSFTTYWAPNDPAKGYGRLSNIANWYGTFAAEWILSRQVMLLRDPNTLSADEHHYPRRATSPQSYVVNTTPLQFQNLATDNVARFQQGRFDLLGVSLEDLRGIVQNAIASEAAVQQQAFSDGVSQLVVRWWHGILLRGPTHSGNLPDGSTYAGYSTNLLKYPRPLRFQSDPIITKPLTADNAARVVNQLTQGVSQFIIEYAGDYLKQDASGVPTGIGADGVIDFVGIDNNGDGAIDERRTRWYGMPRDVDGDGVIGGWTANLLTSGMTPGQKVQAMQRFRDVVPLRDLLSAYRNTATVAAHEVEIRNLATQTDYATRTYTALTDVPLYVCIWTNDTPAMIRILTKVDDPNNRLKDGPWQEMVFSIKR